jgi:hypothetical protein
VVSGCSGIAADKLTVTESMMCFVQLFLAFGLGLDPRNQSAFGPALAPMYVPILRAHPGSPSSNALMYYKLLTRALYSLIGLSSALTIFTTGFLRPGYLGTSLNPARCLGFASANGNFTYVLPTSLSPFLRPFDSSFLSVRAWSVCCLSKENTSAK